MTRLSDDDSHKLAAAMLQKRFAAEDHKQYGTRTLKTRGCARR